MLGWSTSARNLSSACATVSASASPVLSSPLRTTHLFSTLRSRARYTHPRPPWARHPTTSYWPPTRSPGANFGVNENGCPHLAQKPSSRPGVPSCPRPTGAPHSGCPQNFWWSGMRGSSSTTLWGSGTSISGMSTRPRPRPGRESRPLTAVRAVVPLGTDATEVVPFGGVTEGIEGRCRRGRACARWSEGRHLHARHVAVAVVVEDAGAAGLGARSQGSGHEEAFRSAGSRGRASR